ncbi:transcription initiation factor TFIID subunit 4-like isoform X2 [Archocentrus centrarchus]|uniref:transcription initiation factor TFIID subunit 4-like isoform X2 n=1 Tax=Archocentrus centrarchus TaxID=63155 RepID=UPI0011E9DB45|nr:transcription initiation factor TFIID subunit 4-like isoform X2 [Archocentrus centrarchus]
MATNKVVTEVEPRTGTGDGDCSVQVRIFQVPAKCCPITAVQPPSTAAGISNGDSVSAPPKVIPSGQPTTSAVTVPGPRSSSPSVMVVANAGGVSANTQQVTKPALSQVASVKQVTTRGRTVLITVPRSAAAQPVTPRLPQAASPQLPANIQIPPGTMLIRSDSGQLMLVSHQALAQAQQGQRSVSGPPTRILAPQVSAAQNNENVTVIKMAASSSFQQAAPVQKTAVVIGVAPKPALVQTVNVVSERGDHPDTQAAVMEKKTAPMFSKETLESVKKCKNFLVTLIKLASSDSKSASMANSVQGLIRSLLEGKLEAKEFTEQLYDTLKSTPQPCLVPFLKKSLPAVRCLTADPELFIQQASASTRPPKSLSPSVKQSSTETGKTLQSSQQVFQTRGVALRSGITTLIQSRNCISKKPTIKHILVQSGKNFPGGFSVKQSFTHDPPNSTKFASRDSSGSYKEDDDINDVTSMAGVNLREENAQILTTTVGSVVQSCQDQLFLSPHLVLSRILHTGQALGVTDVGPEVVALVSHATQEYLRGLLEKLTVMAEHRKATLKQDVWHTQVSDVRSQLRFLEEIETLQKKRKDEEERERLLRYAKLKQIEEAQLQQREANLTALAAIGPRRKTPVDQTESQVSLLPRPGVQRVTRVILKDLLLCMEQDPFLRHSLSLYKAML